MAFNLNKNEPAGPSKKFDLSKTESPTTAAPPPQDGRSKTRLFALLALLAIGAGAWFFLSKSGSGSGNENAAAAITNVQPDSANVSSVVQNDVAVTTTDTIKRALAENAVATSTSATTTSNTTPDAGNSGNNPDRNSAAGFNNIIPATFAKGSASISKPNQQLVKELVVFLQKNPAAVVTVNGYASSEGELAVNQQISQMRADAFKSYLVAKGIPVNRVNSAGKSIDNPISSNDTEEGRVKNRRVEISIQ